MTCFFFHRKESVVTLWPLKCLIYILISRIIIIIIIPHWVRQRFKTHHLTWCCILLYISGLVFCVFCNYVWKLCLILVCLLSACRNQVFSLGLSVLCFFFSPLCSAWLIHFHLLLLQPQKSFGCTVGHSVCPVAQHIQL